MKMTNYCGMTVTHIKGCPCESKLVFFTGNMHDEVEILIMKLCMVSVGS